MNIMLASISERVREIGIRKSVGAATSDIFIQIIVESVVIAILGGLTGLATSFALVHMISSFSPTDNAPIVTVTALRMAFGFSVLVGVLAGIFPGDKGGETQSDSGAEVRVTRELLNTIVVGLERGVVAQVPFLSDDAGDHPRRREPRRHGGDHQRDGERNEGNDDRHGRSRQGVAGGEDVPPEQEHLADQAPGPDDGRCRGVARICALCFGLISPEMAVSGVYRSRAADKMIFPSEMRRAFGQRSST